MARDGLSVTLGKMFLLMWLTSCCHILCQPLLSSTKYIVVDLVFMVEAKVLRELKFTPALR